MVVVISHNVKLDAMGQVSLVLSGNAFVYHKGLLKIEEMHLKAQGQGVKRLQVKLKCVNTFCMWIQTK